MPDYNKTLTPPDHQVVLETSTGLKFWKSYPQAPAPMSSILTEDPSISIHEYPMAGPGGPFGGFVFCYKGVKIGFNDFDPADSGADLPRHVIRKKDEVERIVWHEITQIGAAVFDRSYAYERDPATGEFPKGPDGFHIRINFPPINGFYATGPSPFDQTEWYFNRFPSRAMQDEMAEIWLDLLNGFKKITELYPGGQKTLPDGSPVWRHRYVFSNAVLERFETGAQIGPSVPHMVPSRKVTAKDPEEIRAEQGRQSMLQQLFRKAGWLD